MTRTARVLMLGAAVLAAGAWYAFRPERLFIDQRVNEGFPVAATVAAAPMTAEPELLASGAFTGVAHHTAGTAGLYRFPDGRRVLRFTAFETSNGPDLQVYLGKASDATDSATVTRAGFHSLGALKGNVGDQNYDIPAELDLDQFQSVTVWCRRFSVNFGTAPLARP